MNRPSGPRNRRRTRSGFTLVELLVVILILAILVALLLPAINAAVKRANDARVAGEINSLSTAIADFMNKMGDYPPSRILLPTSTASQPLSFDALRSLPAAGNPVWNKGGLADISVRDLAARSQRYLSKFWPRATAPLAFNVPGPGTDSYVILEGHECLVLFLGGAPVYDATTDVYSMKGFSKDPTNPFNSAGSNRTQPFFEFAAARLRDEFSTPIAASPGYKNGFPSFMDPLGSSTNDNRPYAYFSAYGSNGYDPNDNNFMSIGNSGADSIEYDDSMSGSPIFRTFRVSFPPTTVGSYGPNPYTSTDPTSTAATYVNPQSFQIISAGRDRQFGVGGAYTPNSTTNKLPVAASENALAPLRQREQDNITNFAAGGLD